MRSPLSTLNLADSPDSLPACVLLKHGDNSMYTSLLQSDILIVILDYNHHSVCALYRTKHDSEALTE